MKSVGIALAVAATAAGLAASHAPGRSPAGPSPCAAAEREVDRLRNELEALQKRALADGKLDPTEAQAILRKTKALQEKLARSSSA